MKSLITERLVLRDATPAEFDAIYRVLVEDIEGPAFTEAHFTPEFQFDQALSQQGLGLAFGRPSIFLQAGGEYMGYCLLMPRLCRPVVMALIDATKQDSLCHASIEAEVGWAIAGRHRGHGYATEAARALIDYGFNELHLPRVVAFTEEDNLPSRRVMEKLGMALHVDAATHTVIAWLENKNPSK
jgi:RimJ/RimL family protein N-acetyltransferase